jgi:hypothetical protein
LAPVELII